MEQRSKGDGAERRAPSMPSPAGRARGAMVRGSDGPRRPALGLLLLLAAGARAQLCPPGSAGDGGAWVSGPPGYTLASWSANAPAATGRDIRSGNPGQVSTVIFAPNYLETALPPTRLRFVYEYVVGYGSHGADVPAGVREPTFTMGLVDGAGAETVVYTSPALREHDYDTCSDRGGWGDDDVPGDGCYSPPVAVDVPARNFSATRWQVRLTMTNGDRNIHFVK